MAVSRAADERDARAIIGLLAEGHSLGQAARLLGLSRRTADRRLAVARSALGAERTTEAIARAQRIGWLGPRRVAALECPATTPQSAVRQVDVLPAAPTARVRSLLRAGRLADAASVSAAWLSYQPAGELVVTQVLLGLRCRSLALLGRTDDAERELASLQQSAVGAGTDLHPSVVAASAEVALWAGLPRRAIERAEVAIASNDAADDCIEPVRTRAWAALELGISVARPARGALACHEGAHRATAAELRGLAALRRGSAAGASRAFDHAARCWASVDAPNALVCRWAADDARRQAGRITEAIAGLRSTLDAAVAMGFEPLSARVRRSLRLAGERPTAPWIPRPASGSLTGRERQVLDLVERGRTNAEIARRMGLGRPTVARLLSNAMDKLGAESRAHAVVLAATA